MNQKSSPEKLKKLAEDFYDKSSNLELDYLQSIANAEGIIMEIYEGRYLLELLQNSRDAAMLNNQAGLIKVRLYNNVLEIANTGLPFSLDGYKSIIKVGDSSKQSSDFIGHKGLGFKSVVQISDNPKIVTQDGCLFFDKTQVQKQPRIRKLRAKLDDIPLFFFPQYTSSNISNEEHFKGYTTLVKLPLRNGITMEDVANDFELIQADQLILLGFLKEIEFQSDFYQNKIEISETQNAITVSDKTGLKKFKVYEPKRELSIPNWLYRKLEPKEQKLFESNRTLEVKIVLSLEENNKVLLEQEPKLYLFYPLEITSGFQFILHAYFSVDPQRKGLRKTELNNFLLSQIAKFIVGDFLTSIKQDFPKQVVEILSFEKNKDAGLDRFYNELINLLRNTPFIYDEVSNTFYTPRQVYIANPKQVEVFSDRVFNNKRLIVFDDKISNWLSEVINVQKLNVRNMLLHIEEYCSNHIGDKSFFNRFYKYVAESRFRFTQKKVLVTPFNTLLSSNDNYVFARDRYDTLELSQELSKYVTFLHPEINLDKHKNDAIEYLGIREFNTRNIVTRLLQDVFPEEPLLRREIILNIKKLPRENIPKEIVYKNILLPVKGKEEWISPLYNPVYFEDEVLTTLFPKGNFIDLERIGLTGDEADRAFLKLLLVWDCPAIYLIEEHTVPKEDWNRNKMFEKLTSLNTYPFTTFNDRFIDVPDEYIPDYYKLVKENWDLYNEFARRIELPKMRCKSKDSYKRTIEHSLGYCHFLFFLRKEKWISLDSSTKGLSVSDVVGINPLDYSRGSKKILKEYLPLTKLSAETDKVFIQNLRIIHLQAIYPDWHDSTIRNYANLLIFIKEKFSEELLDKKFIRFYNLILGYVFDAFDYLGGFENHQTELLEELEKVEFLCVDSTDKENPVYKWQKPNSILYNDDNSLYESLPDDIHELVQPVFTKRDRNKFGRIARVIGRSLKKNISTTLVSEPKSQGIFLLNKFPTLALLAALFESKMTKAISQKQLETIKKARWISQEEIIVELTINIDETPTSIPTHPEWFVSSNKNGTFVLVNESVSMDNRTFPLDLQCLKSLFEEVIGVEVESFELYAEKLLDSSSNIPRNVLFNEFDISAHRIEEILEILKDRVYTPMQQFWDAILLSLNVELGKNVEIPEEKSDLWSFLTPYLASFISEEEFTLFSNEFDYEEYSKKSNMPLIKDLLDSFSIKVSDFNQHSIDNIDFRSLFVRSVRQLKNKKEDLFKKWLYQQVGHNTNYQHLRYKFLGMLHRYDNKFEGNISIDKLDWNIEGSLNKYLNELYPELTINLSSIEINEEHSPIYYYNENRQTFKKLLLAKGLKVEFIDDFLAEESRKSVLYFFIPNDFVELYESYYPNMPTGGESAPDDGDDEIDYSDPFSDDDITETEVTEVEINEDGDIEDDDTTSGTGGRGKGRGNQPTQKIKDLIGFRGELFTYKKLVQKYGEEKVKWVSKNGEKAGKVVEGNDYLGYDMKYYDENDDEKFVEVKATSSLFPGFYISHEEMKFGVRNKEDYEIWLILNVLDEKNLSALKMPQAFIFNNNENFLKNSKFFARANNYKVRLKT
ncbi:DUF3883 domain-containing protein [Aureispira sp. CCB-QB1]|uniref:DUF3883 domain-containing protein n=1 Tax=Aureispira sp. CCB-QB1 TaxID=1313421 RepID=UPI0006968B81|nr:DUF3883 domain-containing protein [Aureispira sp. CCB-QB1]